MPEFPELLDTFTTIEKAELARLKAEINHNAEMARDAQKRWQEAKAELELAGIKLNDRDSAFDKILNDLWQLLYPGKTDWEYPGQVYSHIWVEIERLRTAMKGNQ